MYEYSGFAGSLGLSLIDWSYGSAKFALDVEPRHLNMGGILHGGIIMTMIDVTGGRSGCWSGPEDEPKFSLTVSLTSNFIGQARQGLVTAIGSLRGNGKTIFTSSIDVFDEHGSVIATGMGTYRYRKPFIERHNDASREGNQ
ncbi:PaaI family thioesterase [Agrobacterium sp. T29]|uniref:PaaI family thioesterase n=1 Tax=Agrobacterium sp. T29 TaxID=2580515 RepID=UPI00115F06A9|nr:PaaI family thioesterase [Agrobacterium sp. T29]